MDNTKDLIIIIIIYSGVTIRQSSHCNKTLISAGFTELFNYFDKNHKGKGYLDQLVDD